jgi:hypothetical protein
MCVNGGEKCPAGRENGPWEARRPPAIRLAVREASAGESWLQGPQAAQMTGPLSRFQAKAHGVGPLWRRAAPAGAGEQVDVDTAAAAADVGSALPMAQRPRMIDVLDHLGADAGAELEHGQAVIDVAGAGGHAERVTRSAASQPPDRPPGQPPH